jgi:molybdenum ABC transporter molybdate-binding protein
VTEDLLKRLGMNVELVATDWGSVLARRNNRTPADQGGWSIFHTWWVGPDLVNPALHAPLRGHGAAAWAGWPTDPTGEALRDRWLAAAAPADQVALARQIQAGAPADVVILADDVWITRLSGTGAVRPDSVAPLLTNSLVVIAPAGRSRGGRPQAPFAWTGRIAIGDPDSVPAGRYARQTLTALGLWETLEPRLVLAGDVRAVRAFVARGEVDLGIVYRSDALGFDAVRVVHVPDRQPGIVYPAALTTTAAPGAAELMAFLRGPEATAVFARLGFGTPR